MGSNTILLRGGSRRHSDRVLDGHSYNYHHGNNNTHQVHELGEEVAHSETSESVTLRDDGSLGFIISVNVFVIVIAIVLSLYGLAAARIKRKVVEEEAVVKEALVGDRSPEIEKNEDVTLQDESDKSFYAGPGKPLMEAPSVTTETSENMSLKDASKKSRAATVGIESKPKVSKKRKKRKTAMESSNGKSKSRDIDISSPPSNSSGTTDGSPTKSATEKGHPRRPARRS